MDLTVVTATIPERAGLLTQAVRSVTDQALFRPAEHRIVYDDARLGPARVRNAATATVATEWVAWLDDDDLWLEHHLATIAPHLREDVDVVYTLAVIEGRDGWDPQQDTFDPDRLRQLNYIPLCGVVARAALVNSVGGFDPEATYEDHALWVRLLDAGARWRCVPSRTWVYRFGAWDSRSKEVWDGRRGVGRRAVQRRSVPRP